MRMWRMDRQTDRLRISHQYRALVTRDKNGLKLRSSDLVDLDLNDDLEAEWFQFQKIEVQGRNTRKCVGAGCALRVIVYEKCSKHVYFEHKFVSFVCLCLYGRRNTPRMFWIVRRMSAGSISREPGPRYPWIRLALFDKKLTVIVDHLMSNCR